MIEVAVPTIGGARLDPLVRCLTAVAAGTTLPARVLVVDQSEGDDVAAALAALGLPFPVVRLAQPRLGLSAARNLALDEAAGELLAVTDDDCVPAPGWLAAFVSAFATGAPVAVTGPVRPLPPEGELTEAVSSRDGSERRDFRGGATAPWHVGTGGNMAYSLGRLEGLRFDTRLGAGTPGLAGEDLDLVYRLLARRRLIRFEPDALVWHERQTIERRRETRHGYGHGVGALAGLALRRREPAGLVLLAKWVALRGRIGLRRRAPREELAVLAGTAAGLRYGLRAR